MLILDEDFNNINNEEEVLLIIKRGNRDVFDINETPFDADAALRALGENRIADKRLLNL